MQQSHNPLDAPIVEPVCIKQKSADPEKGLSGLSGLSGGPEARKALKVSVLDSWLFGEGVPALHSVKIQA